MMEEQLFIRIISRLIGLTWALVVFALGIGLLFIAGLKNAPQAFSLGGRQSPPFTPYTTEPAPFWVAPEVSTIPDTEEGELIHYGRDLIAHTSVYLGPNGIVGSISNGLNCQSCHLQAGTVPYGNNLGKVATIYPKLRHRSGTVEGFEKRINDCLERSLNGQQLNADSREMKAIISYLKWLGQGVDDEKSLRGFGLIQLPYLDRAADPLKGKVVYKNHCSQCHGESGEGKLAASGLEWTYPPLYGENSYNIGAGLYRLSNFASFVKYNMPYGVTFETSVLTDEEAWDVAAFINSMPRPVKDTSADWPDITKKPIDHPFGPYADGFSEEQHKFGPFKYLKTANR